MIVAGEASGDHHGARLVEAIRRQAPATRFEFFGATSHHLRRAGVEQIVNADEFAVMGLPEILRRLPMFRQALGKIKREAVRRRADAVILIDFPDFNLQLAKALKKKGLKIIYYISPQLWAWRKYRVRVIKKYVDLLLAILPFEKNWYAQQGVGHVKYVGHPLAGEVASRLGREEFCRKNDLDPEKPLIALLAGSRETEISRILPVMLEAAARLDDRKEEKLQFVIALAATRKVEEVEEALARRKKNGKSLPARLTTVVDQTREALHAADVAAVASGTATLEATLLKTPFVIVYRVSRLNAALIRPLVSVEHFGLVNLIAGERVVPELIQEDFTPDKLAAELERLLEHDENEEMRKKLARAAEKLNDSSSAEGAAAAAARAVLKIL